MYTLQINGFTIEFPFEPYKCQIAFMEKVLEALKTGQNAALESPTGTGKTLCLLCAAIAYIKDCKWKAKLDRPGVSEELHSTSSRSLYPKILYASRTHSQLAQVVRELNKTTYKDIKTVTLASRDLLCINEKVIKEGNSHFKSLMCWNLISKRRCPYYNFYDKADPETLDLLYNEDGMVPDIEDVIRISKKHKYCPYFRNRTMFESADLILLPYNYIVDPCLRRKHNIKLNGNIVIFDEAHNLESVCEESASVSFSTTQLSGCIREAKKVLELLVNDEEEIRTKMDNVTSPFGSNEILEGKEVKVEKNDVAYLLESLHELEDNVDDITKNRGVKVLGIDGRVFPGEEMVKLLSKVGFRKEKRDLIVSTIDKIGKYLAAKVETLPADEQFILKGIHLQEFSSFISVVYADTHSASSGLQSSVLCMTEKTSTHATESDSARYFQLYVTKHESVITLNYWCFSPSISMWYLCSCGLRSIVVTSGTLSPLDSFVSSLGIRISVTLENEHAAHMDQILGARIRCSERGGNDLCGTFHLRVVMKCEASLMLHFTILTFSSSTAEYINGVGQVVIRACQLIPEGVLVFFSSYTVMNSCLKLWKTGKARLWDKLTSCKDAFVEPKSKVELKMVMQQFRQKLNEGGGAVLFAVCRAKVSEGIDFSDSESRGVIVIGIPYAPKANPRIELKKRFLTMQRQAVSKEELTKYMAADEWYQVDAIRGVNQSIGRVLRHKDDFGVVILVDSRFCSMSLKRFPLWMRYRLKNYEDFNSFESECEQFFTKRGIQMSRNSRKHMLLATETTPRAASRIPRNISDSNVVNDRCLPPDIDALYSSEAVAAFESTIYIEETPQKRHKCSVFAEIEDHKLDRNTPAELTFPDESSCSYSVSSKLISRKTKAKLRLKPNVPKKLSNTGTLHNLEEERPSNLKTVTSSQNDEQKMATWNKSPAEYNEMLRAVLKRRRNVLKTALTNYAIGKDFHSLISTFRTETVPNHMELFKGLYSYLQIEHRSQFMDVCRQLEIL